MEAELLAERRVLVGNSAIDSIGMDKATPETGITLIGDG